MRDAVAHLACADDADGSNITGHDPFRFARQAPGSPSPLFYAEPPDVTTGIQLLTLSNSAASSGSA
jgi:hypothetical protein